MGLDKSKGVCYIRLAVSSLHSAGSLRVPRSRCRSGLEAALGPYVCACPVGSGGCPGPGAFPGPLAVRRHAVPRGPRPAARSPRPGRAFRPFGGVLSPVGPPAAPYAVSGPCRSEEPPCFGGSRFYMISILSGTQLRAARRDGAAGGAEGVAARPGGSQPEEGEK